MVNYLMDESLLIEQNDRAKWDVTYVQCHPTPAGLADVDVPGDGTGWASLDPTEQVCYNVSSLAQAVRDAKRWATGSGFRPGRPTVAGYGNAVTIGLKRP